MDELIIQIYFVGGFIQACSVQSIYFTTYCFLLPLSLHFLILLKCSAGINLLTPNFQLNSHVSGPGRVGSGLLLGQERVGKVLNICFQGSHRLYFVSTNVLHL